MRVPTAGWSGAVTEVGGGGGPHTFTIPAGDYYHSSTGTGAGTLGAVFKTIIEATSATGTYTIACAAGENGTGKYTISATGITTFAITWTTTDFRNAMGFTGDIAATLSATGGSQARSLWLPTCAPSDTINGYSAGREVSDKAGVVTASGQYFGFAGESRTEQRIVWKAISRAKTWLVNETTVNASCQKFWRDVIKGEAGWTPKAGGPLRWYPDAASASYFEFCATEWGNFDPQAVAAGWTGLYTIDTGLLVGTT